MLPSEQDMETALPDPFDLWPWIEAHKAELDAGKALNLFPVSFSIAGLLPLRLLCMALIYRYVLPAHRMCMHHDTFTMLCTLSAVYSHAVLSAAKLPIALGKGPQLWLF